MKAGLLLPLLFGSLSTASAITPPTAFVAYPSLAKTGYSAPGQVDIAFSTLGSAAINPQGQALFETRLIGAGSAAGRNRALFANFTGDTELTLQSGAVPFGFSNLPPGIKLTSFFSPIYNRSASAAIFQATATGPKINTTNNRFILHYDGSAISSIKRTGIAEPALSGAILSSFLEVLEQEGANNRLAVVYKLKPDVASSTGSKNDSGLLLMDHTGVVTHAASREGSSSFIAPGAGPAEVFGQFGRATILTGDAVGFTCKVIPQGGKPVDSLFITGLVSSRSVLIQGTTPPGFTAGELLGTFTAIGRLNNLPLLRATLTRSPTATNQGVWNSGGTLLLRKGQTIGGTTVTKVLRVWGVNNNQLVAQVQLSNNAQALILRQTNGTFVTLISTRAPAPDFPSGVDIATFQAIDVDPVNGHFVVLGSLSGVPSSENQALWTGQATLGLNDSQLIDRIPVLQLKKGSVFLTTNTPNDRVRSIAIKPAVDPTGVGARGFAQQISSGGRILVTITGDRGIKELVTLN